VSKFQTHPVLESDLPEVARFLPDWWGQGTPESDRANPEEILRHLVWRLVKNPARQSDTEVGQCIRDTDGRVVGTILYFPEWFLLGDRRLRGLCASSFFVEPPVRMLAFFVFRRFLRIPGFDFWFGTSNNTDGGRVWDKLGGAAVRESAVEYILPVHLGRVMEAVSEGRSWSRIVTPLFTLLGTLATPFLAPRPKGCLPTVEVCRDWERLAYLATQHRDPEVLTCERSVEFLRWRYGESPSPFPKVVYRFDDGKGNEGWFSIGRALRGCQKQVRTVTILDVVWPKRAVTVADIISTVVECSGSDIDMIVGSYRRFFGDGWRSLGFRQRKYGGPRTYIVSDCPPSTELAEAADFVPGDGDTAD